MKAIIYLRTSTKDQNPELQKEQCVEFCKKLDLEVVEIFSEQGSAYRLEKKRPIWESVIKKAEKEKLNIVVWKYDRAFRNREEFYKFMKVMFEVFNIKVYSATQPSILSFWELLDQSHSDNPVFDRLMKDIFNALWNFLIQQAGEEAEEESRTKSQRVKLAMRKKDGMTYSYKGNKWGKKSLRLDKKILELRNQGKTIREIKQLVHYWDKNKNKKFVSIGYVHKVLARNQPYLNKEQNVKE